MSIAMAIIRKRIQSAFEAARSLGVTGPVKPKLFNGEFNLQPDVLATKQTHFYGEQQAADFERKTDLLVDAAHHQVGPNKKKSFWNLGNIDKRRQTPEELYKAAIERLEKKKEKPVSILQTKIF